MLEDVEIDDISKLLMPKQPMRISEVLICLNKRGS